MEKKNGSFSKVRKLVTVLKKCNGKAVVGDSGALISPAAARILMYCGLLAVGIALFLGAYVLEPFVGEFISPKSLAQSVMVALFITTVILAIKDTVTVLYTSDDLALLLPMPFTAGQIVAAKVAVICIFPMGLCFLLLNSICLGYGIRAGAGALFVIGTVLSSILIPVTAIAAAVLLIVIIFRVFGFIRNRDYHGGGRRNLCFRAYGGLYFYQQQSEGRKFRSGGGSASFTVIGLRSVSEYFLHEQVHVRKKYSGTVYQPGHHSCHSRAGYACCQGVLF